MGYVKYTGDILSLRQSSNWSRNPDFQSGQCGFDSRLPHQACLYSTTAVQRFCKPQAGSSNLSAGTKLSIDFPQVYDIYIMTMVLQLNWQSGEPIPHVYTRLVCGCQFESDRDYQNFDLAQIRNYLVCDDARRIDQYVRSINHLLSQLN